MGKDNMNYHVIHLSMAVGSSYYLWHRKCRNDHHFTTNDTANNQHMKSKNLSHIKQYQNQPTNSSHTIQPPPPVPPRPARAFSHFADAVVFGGECLLQPPQQGGDPQSVGAQPAGVLPDHSLGPEHVELQVPGRLQLSRDEREQLLHVPVRQARHQRLH